MACVVVVAVLYTRLLTSSVLPDIVEAHGVNGFRVQLCFLAVLALASTMTVPVVGTLLIFTLLIGPPAGARSLTSSPGRAMALSVALALATVWASIAASYTTNYPVGFYVGTISAAVFALGRAGDALRTSGRLGVPGARLAVAPLPSSHG